MGEKRYIISDASKMVDVESHVLRYWEEELDIEIPRNEMGHRYYTDFHINLLKRIKELKESGFQLKAIKLLVPELALMDNNIDDINELKDELFAKVAKLEVDDLKELSNPEYAGEGINIVENNFVNTQNQEQTLKPSKMEQFQMILSEVVSNALKENTGELGKQVSEIVSDNVIKEMDYLMHIREKQEEERFRRLDETIRNYQNSCRENANKNNGKIFGKFRKKCNT